MMNDIKVTRRVALSKPYEYYEIELTASDGNVLYVVKELEQQVKDIEDFLVGNIKVPKSTPKKEKPKNKAMSFNTITADTKDFDIQDITVTRVGEEQSGTKKDGNQWAMQSLTLEDSHGNKRDLIAWGDLIEEFNGIHEDDRIDVYGISRVNEYKNKHQYTIGNKTDVRRLGGLNDENT